MRLEPIDLCSETLDEVVVHEYHSGPIVKFVIEEIISVGKDIPAQERKCVSPGR